jgi:NAD(P)-dependent dehydrogenase (short-subunit alcohol dehydrogenase family)
MTEEQDVNELAKACLEEFGPPDVLVVSAGVARGMRILETTLADFHRNLGNFLGTFLSCRAIAPVMNAGGSIVAVSTINALVGGALEGVYAGSKAAIHGFCRSLAIELAPRIRVNVIVPGSVETMGPNSARRRAKNPNYFKDMGRATVPLLRVADPRDVANAILFFASDESRHVTGQLLTVDGGTSVAGPYWQIGQDWPDDVDLYCEYLEQYQEARAKRSRQRQAVMGNGASSGMVAGPKNGAGRRVHQC